MPHGFSRLENHATMNQLYESLLKQAADFAAKQVICFSGIRHGMDQETGNRDGAAPSLPVPGPAHAVTPGK
jgi:hypothetical protein